MEERTMTDAEWAEELRQAMVAVRKRAYRERMQRARRTSPWVL